MDTYRIKIIFRRHPAIWKLIAINAGVTVLCWICGAISLLSDSGFNMSSWLAVPVSPAMLALKWWTPISYMFTQTSILHLLFNMMWLFWFGDILADTCGQRRVWTTYLTGGIAGAMLFILISLLFPSLNGANLTGSSAAVVAVMSEAALRQPDRRFRLFLIGDIRLKWLAIISLGLLILGLGGGNAGGQAAHIGGAIAGLSIFLLSRIPRHRPSKRNATKVNAAIKRHHADMARLDQILDKIKLSGYESLTKAEKRELQNLSNM